jgi:coenzyme F420 hydrogenase subunit beta
LTQHARSKYGGNPPVNALLSKAILEKGFSKLGIIGCPCHVHGIRKIQFSQKTRRIARSIKLVLGLFCGTQFYFEGTRHILGELCGIGSLDDIAMIDYRWGDWPGRFYVKTKTGREVLVDRHEYVYHNFLPYWQRDRCTMCIDHTAELADIAIGDFWVPGAKAGDPGWSLVIARNELGIQLLKQAEEEGYIIKHAFDMSGQAPSGAELKKHRSPFVLERRKRYGIPVPDYGFTLGHEPGERRPVHRAPGFSKLAVETEKEH